MATQGLAVTTQPQDVTAELSLSRGSAYTLQNVGAHAIQLSEQASAPTADSAHFVILRPKESITYRVDTAENLYAWRAVTEPGDTRLTATDG